MLTSLRPTNKIKKFQILTHYQFDSGCGLLCILCTKCI